MPRRVVQEGIAGHEPTPTTSAAAVDSVPRGARRSRPAGDGPPGPLNTPTRGCLLPSPPSWSLITPPVSAGVSPPSSTAARSVTSGEVAPVIRPRTWLALGGIPHRRGVLAVTDTVPCEDESTRPANWPARWPHPLVECDLRYVGHRHGARLGRSHHRLHLPTQLVAAGQSQVERARGRRRVVPRDPQPDLHEKPIPLSRTSSSTTRKNRLLFNQPLPVRGTGCSR